MMYERRAVMAAGLATLVAACAGTRRPADTTMERIAAIEAATGGRMGVHIFDTATGRRIGYREDERFSMASTFKAMLAGAILARVDKREFDLGRQVRFSKVDLVSYSPTLEKRIADGTMTIAELCEAAVEVSDNTAANLLLALVGGPQGLTAFARSLGDRETRLDRIEPELNSNLPGDPRDTTTPRAMVTSLTSLFIGDALSADARTQLRTWMERSPTGTARLRAGLPGDWTTGDKTGSGYNGATNDIAITTPPGGKPIFAAVYMSGSKKPGADREAGHAAVGRLIAEKFGPTTSR